MSVREEWVVNLQKIQGPGTAVKFWEIVALGETRVFPDVAMDTTQVYPTLETVNGMQAFVGGLGLSRTFIPHMAQRRCPLCSLGKKGRLGIRAESCLGEGKNSNETLYLWASPEQCSHLSRCACRLWKVWVRHGGRDKRGSP